MMERTAAVRRRIGIPSPISDFWRQREPRERRLLGAALAIAALGLLYLLLIEPAMEARAQLQKSLPVLRQQVGQMQEMARELRASAVDQNAPQLEIVSRENIESSLERAGLNAQNLTVSGDTARVQFSDASFSTILVWLDQVRQSLALTVEESSIVAQTQLDLVNANLTLRQQRRE